MKDSRLNQSFQSVISWNQNNTISGNTNQSGKVRTQACPSSMNLFSSEWPKLSGCKYKCSSSCNKHMLVSEISPSSQSTLVCTDATVKLWMAHSNTGSFNGSVAILELIHFKKKTPWCPGMRAFVRPIIHAGLSPFPRLLWWLLVTYRHVSFGWKIQDSSEELSRLEIL